jgi:CheW-like domain
MSLRCFTFEIGANQYAVPAEAVQQTLPDAELRDLPWMPAFYEGVFHLQGEIVPLVDLRRFVGEPADAPQARGLVMVLAQEGFRLAIRTRAPRFVELPAGEHPIHVKASLFPALDSLVQTEAGSFTVLSLARLQIHLVRTLREHFASATAAAAAAA